MDIENTRADTMEEPIRPLDCANCNIKDVFAEECKDCVLYATLDKILFGDFHD